MSDLGKKHVLPRHKTTNPTEQDLSKHILLCKINGRGKIPTKIKI